MPPRAFTPPAAALSAVSREALALEIAGFSARTRHRGLAYLAENRVGALAFNANEISAVVRGTRQYRTAWTFAGDDCIGTCSCPVSSDCKHLYALGRMILRHTAEQPPEPAASARRAAPAALPPRPASKTALDRLRQTPDVWVRQRALGEMLAAEYGHGLNIYVDSFIEELQEPDPDLRCWRLARTIARRAKGWVPEPLKGYLHRPDLEARERDRFRTGVAQKLVHWAAGRGGRAAKHLRVVLGLRTSDSGEIVVTAEARLSARRLDDAPRTLGQLQQLLSDATQTKGVLSAEQFVLLRWLVRHNFAGAPLPGNGARWSAGPARHAASTLASFLAAFGNSPHVVWDLAIPEALRARAGITPGTPARLRRVPVSIVPVPRREAGEFTVALRVLSGDGSQRPIDDVVYVSRGSDDHAPGSSLVLADGEFRAVLDEPPADLLDEFRRLGELRLQPDEVARVLDSLADACPPVRAIVDGHTISHPVTPMLAMDLREDDWLQLRIFAPARGAEWRPGAPVPSGGFVYEATPDRGWIRSDAPAAPHEASYADLPAPAPAGECTEPAPATAAPEDIWLETPDLTVMRPLADWVARLGAGDGTAAGPGRARCPWPDANVGWWMPANRSRMERLAEAWDERPAGVVYFGTESIRRLLLGAERVTPTIHVTSSGVDWFAVSAEWASEGLQLTDADLARLRSAGGRFIKLSSGWVRKDVGEVQEQTLQVLADLGLEAGQGEQRLTVWQLATAAPESLRTLERLAADSSAARQLKTLRRKVAAFKGLPKVGKPRGLTGDLRPYQAEGLDFLTYASSLGIGAILADDMGLGKTIQALAWLQHLHEREPGGGPSLVVCPASVVHNWLREAARFTPGMTVLALTSGAERHQLRGEIARHDLVVTNYALLRRDIVEWEKVELRAAILDEAQNIKNPDAAVTGAAQRLRARHRLALTGTPLENRALDLWSICSFVNPGYLPNRAQFTLRYDRPDAPPHVRRLLAAKLRPIFLRRTKQAVAPDLPERIEERRDCVLTAGQRKLYLAELRRSRALVDELSRQEGGLKQNTLHILAALTRLRQVCCHPALAGANAALGSAKFDSLFELLEPLLEEGHKVLVFSQFVTCLDLLAARMRQEHIAHHMLTGKTPTKSRKAIIERFQADPKPSVFLLSLKAGGTGLNLTAASYVVLFDPWWNPAVEAQAIDRTHRIGQDRTVIAYRMIAEGTIEEKIWELQQRKAALMRDLLGEDGFVRSLSREDLDFLLAES